jgi:sialic acid synthase SpsE
MGAQRNDLHFIAEAGTNHGGQLSVARDLAQIAADAKADSVKFQLIYPEGLYLPEQRTESGAYEASEVFEKRRAMMLTDDQWRELAARCRDLAIPMSASVFDERGVKLLDELDAPYLKFASCDLNNSALLRAGAETGRRLIVSTGMSTLGEIERAVLDLTGAGAENIVLLHCVSAYPAATRDMNLSMIRTLESAFGFPVGLSDHTESSAAASAAVALGATWFEKHFTYDRGADGFDHAYAMEPAGLASYIDDVRSVAQALAPSPKKLRPAEEAVAPRARRGLWVARDIPAGQTITKDDVVVVRPAGPMAPNSASEIIGRTTTRPLARFEPWTPEAVS